MLNTNLGSYKVIIRFMRQLILFGEVSRLADECFTCLLLVYFSEESKDNLFTQIFDAIISATL